VKALLERRYLFAGLPLVLGAVVAWAVVVTGSVSAASGNGTPQAAPGQVTIYSETFLPYTRPGDADSLLQARYTSLDGGYGPGNYPNLFVWNSGSGHDAFFNTPDVTIGDKALSAVSAQVCLTLHKVTNVAYMEIILGVQDKDGNVTFTQAMVNAEDDGQQCPTLTFPTPVELVNNPHLVLVLDMKLHSEDWAGVDGVTYTLQPTKKGDVAPGPGVVYVTPSP
jgi:hypothetical protein